ncbi:hypothetical protein GCM10007416_07940 [Kroppenstedtia guangzhouensis]|uniref:Amino acid adenylation domain-containing protein n=1 Tax=Kroppenstedtia guangzhouensis TaxID=1274356 RepID=A0ABQ1G607_9BACL|nr:hypothetical protein GCM10007416_07940 [Kroppenstedtia guangzhouensis]
MAKIRKQDIEDILALTPTQEGILFHYLKEPHSRLYREEFRLRLSGEISLPLFKAAWQHVVQTNEMLRTVFRWEGVKQPVQIVLKEYPLRLLFSEGQATEDEEAYDLRRVPFSVELCRLGEMEYEMILRHHHILFDGWSNGIVLLEFVKAYRELVQGKTPIRLKKPGFKEYILWQQKQDKSGQQVFWQEYLAGLDESLPLSAKSKDSVDRTAACTYTKEIGEDRSAKLRKFVREQGVTLAALFYTAWGLLLQRYKNSRDVLFGTTVSGREGVLPGAEEMVGLFINTPPLRVTHRQGQTVLDLLRQVQRDLQERSGHESTPLVDLNASFDTIVVVENYPLDVDQLTGRDETFRITDYEMRELTHYDLTLSIECFDAIKLVMMWPENLFQEQMIVRMTAHFLQILDEMTADVTQPVETLQMLTDEEQSQLRQGGLQSDVTYPHSSLHQLFELQAQKHPERIALTLGDRQMTYGQLNRYADQVAYVLRRKGVDPDSLVAVMLEPSFDMIAVLLGVLKAGGAYVPIDPDYPQERISFTLEDSGAKWLITSEPFQDKAELAGEVLLVGDFPRMAEAEAVELPEVRPDNLAYVIYTSGTTGRPKGVMIEHRNVVQLVMHEPNRFHFSDQDVWLLFHSFSFDMSVWEMYGALLHGGRLVIVPKETTRDSYALVELVTRERVTVLNQTPSAFYMFQQAAEERSDLSFTLRLITFGGEKLKPGLLKSWRKRSPKTVMVNMYGITETTVHVTYKEIGDEEIQSNLSAIGVSLPTYSCYVLDAHKCLTPKGMQGELYVGGGGVARGYLNRPELNAERFIENPYRPGERLYKSGDWVRLLENGEMEYIGRIDHQVKIRGYRIETGEIEHHLQQHEAVKEAVVLAIADQEGMEELCAYVLIKQKVSPKELRHYLGDKIPSYMIPAYFVPMTQMPLTSNGKVDRRSLPKPDPVQHVGNNGHVGLQDEVEAAVAEVWKEVLGLEKVGLHDHFFDIGGNSLKMIRLLSRLNSTFSKEINIPTLFRHTTVHDQARYYRDEVKSGEIAVQEPIQKATSAIGSDVAVVGMAVRMPGAADVGQFWNNLQKGVESIRVFTDEELREAGIPEEQLQKPNYVKAKGYLEDTDAFDNRFFEYGVKEAEMMDPQLRILHECSWEALEHAGEAAENGKAVGVYVGGSPNFHWLRSLAGKDLNALDEFQAMLLNEKDFFATRLSHKLNLTGPAVTVQTACSTSLVAIGNAWADLVQGRCDLALAGGVSVTYPIKSGYLYEEGMIHSPDGHCRAFDRDAQGTVSGNGVGVVVMKRLEDALRDGNTVYAVIKSTAINNDGGHKAGFTAPGVEGQASVIRAAHQAAGIKPEEVSYVETHGTGTPLGDPIEIEALKLAFGEQKPGQVMIGSVKTNIGHLDAAAGVAGFVKTVLALYHRKIPPSLHYQRPNPKIDFGKNPFRVNSTLTSWEEGIRRAGVSSFGMGGTNAHVVLESAPDTVTGAESREWKMLTLSAKSTQALDKAAENLARHLEAEPQALLSDMAYTLHVGRRDFPHRRMVVAADVSDAVTQLRGTEVETSEASERRPVIFLFSGQGSQYVNMGRGLYESEPVFREQIDRGLTALTKQLGFNVGEVLYPPRGSEKAATQRLMQTGLAQPLLFLIEYALAKLLIRWGVRPQLMMGHSIGEYVAACLAEVLSFEDALRLVALRGELMQKLPVGSMLGVNLSEAEVRPLLTDELDLAAVNSPQHVVVSGPTLSVDQLERKLSAGGVKTTRLHTSHAFHSRMMDPILRQFEQEVAKMPLSAPKIPYLSNVTGRRITVEQATSPEYWARHLRNTVQFSQGLSELFRTEQAVFLEIGPGRMLSTLVQAHPERKNGQTALHLLRHPLDPTADSAHLLRQLGRLWMLGGTVDWKAFYAGEQRRLVPLPTYPFEKRRFPSEPQATSLFSGTTTGGKRSDVDEWFYLPSWERNPLPGGRDGRRWREDEVWLIFLDRHGRTEPLVARLQKEGQRVITVKKDEWFSRTEEVSYTIHPREKADYEALFTDLERRGLLPHKIVHAWSLNGANDSLSRELVEQVMDEGYYSLLYTAQSIGRREGQLQLYVLTERMLEVTGTEENLSPEQATVLGFTKICGLEFPNFSCRTIDLDLPSQQDFTEAVLDECLTDASDPVVAYRGRHRWIQTVVQSRFEKESVGSGRLREGGVYLITGGLGGIGFAIAKDLARSVPGVKLALVGRSEFPPRSEWDRWLDAPEMDPRISDLIRSLRKMEAQGAESLVLQGDVAEKEDMCRVLEEVKTRFGHIDGVVHAAGVADYLGVMMNRDKEGNDAILAPKIAGTLLLDSLLKEEPLEFFVLCSSIGNIAYHMKFGQSGYNAANEFLDAFAFYKSARDGVFTVAINWPDWQEVGMSLQSAKVWAKQFNTDVESMLHDGVTAKEGVEVFRRILCRNHHQVVVSPVDLHWKLKHGVKHYTQMLEQRSRSKPKQQRSGMLSAYTAPTNEIEQKLCELLQDMFGLEQIGIHDNFFDLGMSSLDLLRVNAKLKDLFKRDLPVVTLYEHSTIHALAKYLGYREPIEEPRAHEELNKAKSVMKNTLSRLGKRQ